MRMYKYCSNCRYTLGAKLQILLLYAMKRCPFLILLVLLAGALILSSCEKDEEENPDLSTIEYTLTSEEAGKLADIEYTSVLGIVMKLEDEPLPWSTSFKAILKLGDAISFEAESGTKGAMTARIIVDDEVVASNTATFLVQLDYIKGLK